MQKWARLVIAAAIAGAAISLYQWVELYNLRTAGTAPACAVSETVNCADVWNSALSNSVHAGTGIPFPGWGLIWSIVVIALAFPLLIGGDDRKSAFRVGAMRLTTGVGAVVCVALLGYSLTIGVVCPTCVMFYIAVFVATAAVFIKLKPNTSIEWPSAALHSVGWLVAGILLLIYPGTQTPSQRGSLDAVAAAVAPATTNAVAQSSPLQQFIASLRPELQQALSDTLNAYRNAPVQPLPVDEERITHGPANTPLHFVEWVDILCPHCRNLHLALSEIGQITPAGSWTLESRNYPLDSECNSAIKRSGNDGVRCLSAKILICLAGDSRESSVRDVLFENQDGLKSTQQVWNLAAPDSAQRESLEGCVSDPTTSEKLAEDIEIAERYGIRGTPMVVLNGRVLPGLPALIYAIILAQGDVDHEAFSALPPPQSLPE